MLAVVFAAPADFDVMLVLPKLELKRELLAVSLDRAGSNSLRDSRETEADALAGSALFFVVVVARM